MWAKRKVHKQARAIPDYRLGPHYDGSGSAVFTFEREFTDPLYVYNGPGKVTISSLRVTQHPQVYFFYRNTAAGIGGVQHGQSILQPLVDNTGG